MSEDLIYKNMYLHLFNAVTDALELIEEQPLKAEVVLKLAQQDCESMYLDAEESNTRPIIRNLPGEKKKS